MTLEQIALFFRRAKRKRPWLPWVPIIGALFTLEMFNSDRTPEQKDHWFYYQTISIAVGVILAIAAFVTFVLHHSFTAS